MDDEAAVLWVDEDVLVLCEAAKGFVDRDTRGGDDSGARGRGGRVGGEDKEAEAGGEDDEGRRVVSLWEGCTRTSQLQDRCLDGEATRRRTARWTAEKAAMLDRTGTWWTRVRWWSLVTVLSSRRVSLLQQGGEWVSGCVWRRGGTQWSGELT